jgi:hypothetical protein
MHQAYSTRLTADDDAPPRRRACAMMRCAVMRRRASAQRSRDAHHGALQFLMWRSMPRHRRCTVQRRYTGAAATPL